MTDKDLKENVVILVKAIKEQKEDETITIVAMLLGEFLLDIKRIADNLVKMNTTLYTISRNQ